MFMFVLGVLVGASAVMLWQQWLWDELGEAERRATEDLWLPQRPVLSAEELRRLREVKERTGGGAR